MVVCASDASQWVNRAPVNKRGGRKTMKEKRSGRDSRDLVDPGTGSNTTREHMNPVDAANRSSVFARDHQLPPNEWHFPYRSTRLELHKEVCRKAIPFLVTFLLHHMFHGKKRVRAKHHAASRGTKIFRGRECATAKTTERPEQNS